MRPKDSLAAGVAVAALVVASIAQGGPPDHPSVHAHPITNGDEVRIDGRLDESIWRSAEQASGFRCWDPNRGAPPSEETVFQVAFDRDAIYFAVTCKEKDTSRIRRSLSRRDRFTNSDLVSVYIDPLLDKTTGYNFKVNPLGVQQDGYVYNDGEMDMEWDSVWEAETSVDENGWYAEIRIPFSSIRYRADGTTWGLNVYRYMHGRGEDTAWVVWDRETSGFVSRFGTLTGLSDIPAPRRLEVVPYAVARAADRSIEGPESIDDLEKIGLDLKYGVTSDLALNATIQPDFGQVEADPAVLNLSPFETFYEEKRPFFIEGSRFFEQPDFSLFYSRRIGTGDENARIRYAAKVTGKTKSDLSIGLLAASTDITDPGKSHNPFRAGSRPAHFFLGRVGKDFREGRYRFHLMQTAVTRTGSPEEVGPRDAREAYTTGADFRLLTPNRGWSLDGSFVGSIIDPESKPGAVGSSPARVYGTGGEIEASKLSGVWRGTIEGRWESDRLELNDMGFLNAPDEVGAYAWIGYRHNPDNGESPFNRLSLNWNLGQSWLYGDRTGLDLATGERAWSYSAGHLQFRNGNFNANFQLRSYYEGWFGFNYNGEGTQRYETRSSVRRVDGSLALLPGGGPLMSEPATYGGWAGLATDGRKDVLFYGEFNYWLDTADNRSIVVGIGSRWNQSSAVDHSLEVSVKDRTDDTQHLGNFETPGEGIGSVSFVFAEIEQKTIDLTLRSNILFNRDQSLELYLQPFLTSGDYSNPRRLARPDSYEFEPYTVEGFRAQDRDFLYASANLNLVYRWQYRPGSALYLVWTHSRSSYNERRFAGETGKFTNRLDPDRLFRNEPENVILAKISYYIPI